MPLEVRDDALAGEVALNGVNDYIDGEHPDFGVGEREVTGADLLLQRILHVAWTSCAAEKVEDEDVASADDSGYAGGRHASEIGIKVLSGRRRVSPIAGGSHAHRVRRDPCAFRERVMQNAAGGGLCAARAGAFGMCRRRAGPTDAGRPDRRPVETAPKVGCAQVLHAGPHLLQLLGG